MVTTLPPSDDIERASKFTREPFLSEGEDPASLLAPGTAHRRAFDAALAEIDAGLKVPSVAWRRNFSLLLGLERLLSQDQPALVDGTVLSAHQVDALSGTLTALLAEAQRNGDSNGNGDRRRGRGGAGARRHPGRGGARRGRARRADGLGRAGRRRRRRSSPRRPEDPNAEQALLVRARDRRRQDRRRARLRRGVAHRRHPDPHPPPQPRRPVPRRAARPRLRQAHRARPAEGPGPRRRPGHGRDLPVVRAQRREGLRRVHDRHLRRGAHGAGREDLRARSASGPARSSSA